MIYTRIDALTAGIFCHRVGSYANQGGVLGSPLFSPLFQFLLPLAGYRSLPFEVAIIFFQRLSVAAEMTPQMGKVRLGDIALHDLLGQVPW